MKKNYEELELKVIRFASEDVITASGEQTCPPIEICLKLDICIDKLTPCLQCDGIEICKKLNCLDCVM